MKGFPSKLRPENKANFAQFRFDRYMAYARRHIYEAMLSSEFVSSVSLQNIPGMPSQYQIDKKILDQLEIELRALDWNTKISYGGSVLFIWGDGPEPEDMVACSGGFD